MGNDDVKLTRETRNSRGPIMKTRRRRNRRKKSIKTNRSDFEESSRIAEDWMTFTLSATHYLVEVTIGGSVETMVTAQFAFDTGKDLMLSADRRYPLDRNVSLTRRGIHQD